MKIGKNLKNLLAGFLAGSLMFVSGVPVFAVEGDGAGGESQSAAVGTVVSESSNSTASDNAAPSDTSVSGDTGVSGDATVSGDTEPSDTSKSDATEPDATEPDTSVPDTSVSDTDEPDATEPDTNVPGEPDDEVQTGGSTGGTTGGKVDQDDEEEEEEEDVDVSKMSEKEFIEYLRSLSFTPEHVRYAIRATKAEVCYPYLNLSDSELMEQLGDIDNMSDLVDWLLDLRKKALQEEKENAKTDDSAESDDSSAEEEPSADPNTTETPGIEGDPSSDGENEDELGIVPLSVQQNFVQVEPAQNTQRDSFTAYYVPDEGEKIDILKELGTWKTDEGEAIKGKILIEAVGNYLISEVNLGAAYYCERKGNPTKKYPVSYDGQDSVEILSTQIDGSDYWNWEKVVSDGVQGQIYLPLTEAAGTTWIITVATMPKPAEAAESFTVSQTENAANNDHAAGLFENPNYTCTDVAATGTIKALQDSIDTELKRGTAGSLVVGNDILINYNKDIIGSIKYTVAQGTDDAVEESGKWYSTIKNGNGMLRYTVLKANDIIFDFKPKVQNFQIKGTLATALEDQPGLVQGYTYSILPPDSNSSYVDWTINDSDVTKLAAEINEKCYEGMRLSITVNFKDDTTELKNVTWNGDTPPRVTHNTVSYLKLSSSENTLSLDVSASEPVLSIAQLTTAGKANPACWIYAHVSNFSQLDPKMQWDLWNGTSYYIGYEITNSNNPRKDKYAAAPVDLKSKVDTIKPVDIAVTRDSAKKAIENSPAWGLHFIPTSSTDGFHYDYTLNITANLYYRKGGTTADNKSATFPVIFAKNDGKEEKSIEP